MLKRERGKIWYYCIVHFQRSPVMQCDDAIIIHDDVVDGSGVFQRWCGSRYYQVCREKFVKREVKRNRIMTHLGWL
jgi:hypothetical protein